MKQIKILVSFKDNEMIFPNIEFVKNDYNHVEFIFDFDEDDGKKVFELKKPNGKVFIKEIIDNKVLLSDFDEKGNIIPVINQSGLYEFEITKYKSDSKFTISKVCQFMARDEIVNIDDDIVDKDASLPILNDLITTTIALKENTEKIGQLVKEKGDYAEEQGNYAKEAASNVINANNQATKLINNFESNVNEYTSDFNKKATTKQEKFDSNSTTKINEYNDNATSKLKQYNDNHESKLKDYNDNASEKTKAFNSNSLLKTTAYDKNADDKLSAYNTNGATKLDEYNDNATLKTEEYNTNASSKIEEYNSNATQKLEEYDEHSEELNNKINSTNSELEKLKDEILEIGEVSDSYIHVEDSTMSKLKSLSIDGICEQVTTSGKNLLKSNLLPITKNGITISKNDNGDIVVNGTITGISSGFVSFYIGDAFTIEKGTYTSSVQNKKIGIGLTTAGFGGSLNITMADNVNFKTATATETQTIKPQINIRYDAETFNNYIFNPMLEKSSTANEYEPYTGGQPSPNADYPQEIKTITDSLKITSCNKNLTLMNIDSMTKGGITITNNNNGSLTLNGTATSSFDLVLATNFKLYAGTYTHSINKIFKGVYVSLDNIAKTMLNGAQGKTKATFEMSEDKTYNKYFIWIDKDTVFNNDTFYIQLERGSTQTLYEEHLETQITANLPEGEFIGKISDTYKDTLKVEYNEEDGQYHLVLNKTISKFVLDGSEDWLYYTATNKPLFYIILDNLSHKTDYLQKSGLTCYCDYFAGKGQVYTFDNVYNLGNNVIAFRNSYKRLVIRDDRYINSEDFKTWLSTHNTEVYYVLETPYKIDLGVVDMPITYNEITNLFTDSDLLPQINAKYYRNFTSTIQNLQVNNKALKQELIDINTRLSALENATTSVTSESEVVE